MRAFRINDRRGFTLVELMAVVMILGLMITLTAANWRRIVPRAQLNAAVRSLSNVLNGTRSEAIARNAEFRVLYDLDNEAYWVETPYKKTGGLAAERIPGEPDPEEDLRGKIDFKELATASHLPRSRSMARTMWTAKSTCALRPAARPASTPSNCCTPRPTPATRSKSWL